MNGRRAGGLLAAAVLVGTLAYFALDKQVYEQGISVNLKLVAVVGGILGIAGGLLIAFRQKKSPD